MPLQIPATSFVVFAQLMGGHPGDGDNGSWSIADRVTQENVVFVSGFRQIATAESCLAFARAEAERLKLGESSEVRGGPVTHLRFANAAISYSCACIEPAAAVVAVSGPEELLEKYGYEFTYER